MLDLSHQIEGLEALNNFRFAEAINRISPDTRAVCRRIGGGIALYAGVDSPMTQIFGFGMNGKVGEDELDQLEAFYRAHRAPVCVEVCEWADEAVPALLTDYGYHLTERTLVLTRSLAKDLSCEINNRVQRVPPTDAKVFARIVARGFAESDAVPATFVDLFQAFCFTEGTACFMAFQNDDPTGGGCVTVHRRVAMLFAASVLPTHRNRGTQLDLIKARLQYAAAQGCNYAVVTASPGTGSIRNLEKCGFRMAYARSKYVKKESN